METEAQLEARQREIQMHRAMLNREETEIFGKLQAIRELGRIAVIDGTITE